MPLECNNYYILAQWLSSIWARGFCRLAIVRFPGSMKGMNEKISALVQLSHEIGREDRRLAILGEGNTSVKLDANQFAIKASGCCLNTLTEADVTICDSEKMLALLDHRSLDDETIDEALFDARIDAHAKKPSTESMFHAWLLSLDGVNFVGHCHSLAANQILCSPRGRDFAERRLFPDEIVCCGAASVFVPYVDPGLPLGREIRERTKEFLKKQGCVPRLILLQNHGIIALGATANGVLACLLMAAKAAEIFLGAATLGGPIFLTPHHVERITLRPDEAYRQRELQI
jgi:rhamnose utilization protein RhaD (predicted bifunctional aldolase and dehydrogenase)